MFVEDDGYRMCGSVPKSFNLWADEERLTFVPQLSNEQVLLLDLLL